jgi:hypothetical protein
MWNANLLSILDIPIFMLSYIFIKHISIFYAMLQIDSNTTGVSSGAGNAYSSGTHEIMSVFRMVRVAYSLVLCVVFCR